MCVYLCWKSAVRRCYFYHFEFKDFYYKFKTADKQTNKAHLWAEKRHHQAKKKKMANKFELMMIFSIMYALNEMNQTRNKHLQ